VTAEGIPASDILSGKDHLRASTGAGGGYAVSERTAALRFDPAFEEERRREPLIAPRALESPVHRLGRLARGGNLDGIRADRQS
jgi:hypothetical protein